jgi:hypothetical protein
MIALFKGDDPVDPPFPKSQRRNPSQPENA